VSGSFMDIGESALYSDEDIARISGAVAKGECDVVSASRALATINRYRAETEAAKRESKAFGEALDNIRAALGQESTLPVMAADVKELVDAVEKCDDGEEGCRAYSVLERLRRGSDGSDD